MLIPRHNAKTSSRDYIFVRDLSCIHNICLACKTSFDRSHANINTFLSVVFQRRGSDRRKVLRSIFFFFSYCAHFIDLSRGLEEETFASSTNAFCVGSQTLLGMCVECVSSQSLCFSKSFFLRVFRFSSLIKNTYFIRSLLL